MQVDVEITGAEELQADLNEADRRVNASPRPLLAQIAGRFAATVRGNIEAFSGEPLSAASLEIRARRGQGSRPLVASGAMAASVQPRVTEDEASAGPTVDYAAHQQFGFTTGAKSAFPGKTVPARPFALLDENDVEGALDVLEEGLLGA